LRKGERGEKAKQLANPASKMAKQLMMDYFPDILRLVHEAFRRKKIVCPEQKAFPFLYFSLPSPAACALHSLPILPLALHTRSQSPLF